jgi:hypothetical protein
VAALLALLAPLIPALIALMEWKQTTHKPTYENGLEDEIDALANDGSPAAKLRLERLAQRLKRSRES